MGLCSWCPYLNKWLTLSASLGVALCCGLTYCFAIWSGELKDVYGLRQDQLELIAAAANAGGYFGIASGLTYDALLPHKKFGPRFTLALGLLLNAGGYVGLWAALTGRFHAQFWQLVGLAALAANGGTWGDTAILVSNVRNFPSSRGSVVGLLKAAIGLSGSLFAAVYSGIFAPNKAAFLLFLAFAPLFVGLLALPFVNVCLFVQRSEMETGTHVFTAEGRFIFALQALGTLGVYLITAALLGSLYPLSRSARLVVVVGAGLLLLPLLLISTGSGGLLSRKAVLSHTLSYYPGDEEEEEEEGVGGGDEEGGGAARGRAAGAGPSKAGGLTQPLLEPGMQRDGGEGTGSADAAWLLDAGSTEQDELPTSSPLPGAAAAAEAAAAAPSLPPDLTPTQCLRTPDFWLLFAVLFVGMGSGLTLLNNLAQLVKALTGGASAAEVTPVLVSLFSVANCAGRMVGGYLPERLLHSRGTPRLLFLPLASVLMAGTCLGLGFAGLPALYPLAGCAGFAFGCFWSLFPSLTSELFGLTRFAANYTLGQFAPLLGSFGLAAGLAGALYERALARQGAGAEVCLGRECYRYTFWVLAGLGAAATAAAAALLQRRAPLYAAEFRELRRYDRETQRSEAGDAGGGGGGGGGGAGADT